MKNNRVVYRIFHMVESTLLLTILVVVSACSSAAQVTGDPAGTDPAGLPNPASVYCQEQGFTSEIRTAADGSQGGVCIFPDGSECEEWAYFRGECLPAGEAGETPSPSAFPTARPIDPAEYQGWWTYTHATYGFSIMLPEDWVAEEVTTSDPIMNGHTLLLQPRLPGAIDTGIRMTFRQAGEDYPLWPTGVGSGSFQPEGTLDVDGQAVQRILFVCPTGQVNSIWYQGNTPGDANIHLGNMEFGFIFAYTGAYCEDGYSLAGKIQHMGEMIIASLQLP